MKTLLILRHGKSSWSTPGASDHQRPLKPRGERDAARMGREMRRRDVIPNLVLSSTAQRARSTAHLAVEAMASEVRLIELDELYLTSVEKLLDITSDRASQAHSTVLLVGHNPTFEDTVSHLTRSPVHMTTGNLACIDLDIEDWIDLPQTRGKLRFLLRPKELPEES